MARPWDRLEPREYLRLQERLLRDLVVRFLYPFSPFYRRLFDEHGIRPERVRRLRDLERLPLVSREDFQGSVDDEWRPFRGLLRPDEQSLKRWAHRGLLSRVAWERLVRGDEAAERLLAEEFKPVHLHPSSSGPVVGYTVRDLSALSQAGARAFAVMGASRSDVLVSALPLGPHLPFWHVYYGALGAGMSAFHVGGGEVVRPARAARLMEEAGAGLLVAQPGYAEGLLLGAPPSTFAPLRILALWGEDGLVGARERFTTRLRAGGAPSAAVTALLGIPEARVAWGECPTPPAQPEASNGYHTYPDLELLEIVDPDTGAALADNEPGEIVYTSLDWRGSALLRFRTGLIARRGITHERCPGCRRSVPRIPPDLSRTEWRVLVMGSKGRVQVDLADVLPVLWRATGVPQWQVDVNRGAGERETDSVTAWLGGAGPEDVRELQRAMAPFGVRCRAVPLSDLNRRMGVGMERPEVRVRVRGA